MGGKKICDDHHSQPNLNLFVSDASPFLSSCIFHHERGRRRGRDIREKQKAILCRDKVADGQKNRQTGRQAEDKCIRNGVRPRLFDGSRGAPSVNVQVQVLSMRFPILFSGPTEPNAGIRHAQSNLDRKFGRSLDDRVWFLLRMRIPMRLKFRNFALSCTRVALVLPFNKRKKQRHEGTCPWPRG